MLFNINNKNLNSFTFFILEETHFFKGNSNFQERENWSDLKQKKTYAFVVKEQDFYVGKKLVLYY
ncbi:hypothetical protein ES705_34277 [subsurface metagenome]